MIILFLYSEIMGYTMATLTELAKQGATLHVVHWDHKKLTPYKFCSTPSIITYNRSEMSVNSMQKLADDVKPDITVVSGWMDRGYLKIAKKLIKQKRPVVCGLDDQWHGHFRQVIAFLLGRLGFFFRYFSHAWVTGTYQYEYARKLGYSKAQIIYELYSADITVFHKAYLDCFDQKLKQYPHRFLFVGRLESVKGLDILLNAWQKIAEMRKDWELHIVGNGSLKSMVLNVPGVVVKDFMQPDALVKEIADTGCFILPSHFEPWGVVVHEFAAAGLPLILSDVVGAASTFLISGLNGYHFRRGDIDCLVLRLLQIVDSSDDKLRAMARASHLLSNRILPETSAASLLSIQS
nr:glycosyltransferase [Cytophagales bacterium]